MAETALKKDDVQAKAKKALPTWKKIAAVIGAVVAIITTVITFVAKGDDADVGEAIKEVTEVVTEVTGQPVEDTTPEVVEVPAAE